MSIVGLFAISAHYCPLILITAAKAMASFYEAV